MAEIVRFVPKSELERARLIREARAIYESIGATRSHKGSPGFSGPKVFL